MLPSVSILVCTYGRTTFLQEALESFARQEYDGALHMVIVNDCPLQTLTTIVPGVDIINLDHTCESYAAKRNLVLEHARHELTCLWDDDDIYLPDFVATVVAKLGDDDKAMRLSRLMKWDGRFAKIISGSQYHTAVFRTAALRELGGWRNVDVTDEDFVRRLVQYRFFHGEHHHVNDGIAPLVIYRNDPERVHLDGISREAYMELMNRRIYAKKEPRGLIDLSAGWTQDWVTFVEAHTP